MTRAPDSEGAVGEVPRALFEAVGGLALAIAPHNMDTDKRRKVREALHVLVDHIIAVGEARARLPAAAVEGEG